MVLVVYSDYRCSFCRDFDRKLRAVRKRYPEHLAVVVKSFVVLDTYARCEIVSRPLNAPRSQVSLRLSILRRWRCVVVTLGRPIGGPWQIRWVFQTSKSSVAVFFRQGMRSNFGTTTPKGFRSALEVFLPRSSTGTFIAGR